MLGMQWRLWLESGFTVVKECPHKYRSTSVFPYVFVWSACPVRGLEGQVFSQWAKQLLAFRPIML